MTEQQAQQVDDSFSVEVATYFNELAPSWSKNYTPQGAMRHRIERFASAIAEAGVNTGSLLDFGCGAGTISSALAGLGYQVTGCDISSQMVETAQQSHSAQDIRWIALNPSHQRLPFDDGEFSAVIASSVLEYVPDPTALLAEFRRILAPNGLLVCTVPDERHAVRQAEQAWLTRAERPLRKFVMHLLPRFMPYRHRYNYLRLSVCRWPAIKWQDAFAQAGFNRPELAECNDPLMLLSATRANTIAHV